MSKFQFAKKAARIKAAFPRLLDQMANNAVIEFKVKSFDKESFDGSAWARRKPNASRNDGRRLLVDTGRMRQSVRVLGSSQNSRTIGSDVPYAAYHNTGTSKLPKRKFIGNNKKLERTNKMLIFTTLSKIV